jgi:hypothetical protein
MCTENVHIRKVLIEKTVHRVDDNLNNFLPVYRI